MPVVVVHGGAGDWRVVFEAARREGLDLDEGRVLEAVRAAALAGLEALEGGGSALDAVVEAVRYMEDSGVFNAGVGSALDAAGGICMDAGVMYSEGPRAGAVACVRHPRNPVVLARRVMELTDHVIMCCGHADRLAEELGLEAHPGPSPRARALWSLYKERLAAGSRPASWWNRNSRAARLLGILPGDTVGAVAVDAQGRLAAAVSTGGTTFKLPGRIGDSPVPGAGFYALPGGAAAATGVGEAIMIAGLSLRAVELMRQGVPAGEAGRAALALLERLTGMGAGLILAEPGSAAAVFNTASMPHAIASPALKEPVASIWKPTMIKL
ncbi:MAG: isoaspartyl peptidase/L-asparaginase [Desulfurococcales archaeon]|nr:isoaspartyl peptidase/L-asparaginase [Desulfurococcales archaeon]